jgi:hypothetical protein
MASIVWWCGDHIAVYDQNAIWFQAMAETIDRVLRLSD